MSLKRSRSNSSSAAGRRDDEALEQRIAAIEKRAPVGHAGQRIGLRRQPLLEFSTLLPHRDPQERHAESDEQRLEGHHGRHCAMRVAATHRRGQVLRVRNARQEKTRMPDHQPNVGQRESRSRSRAYHNSRADSSA